MSGDKNHKHSSLVDNKLTETSGLKTLRKKRLNNFSNGIDIVHKVAVQLRHCIVDLLSSELW